MPNHLAGQTSPYLLQHQHNPVEWYPWGAEALERSRREQKPIFLSIGYSACHWCHVMEHESFEDAGLAKLLNEKFICIKVDREERPDLDQLYMQATQLMTGRGGWPMSVFLTPERKPFYAGTYWPPRAARGMPGFDQVLAGVAAAWDNKRVAVDEAAERLTHELARLGSQERSAGSLTPDILTAAASALSRNFDGTYGGFGEAPKFPAPMSLQFLLRRWHRSGDAQALEMVRLTLDRMAAGGIYDHLGGGFARYAVDARWLVPHFEKPEGGFYSTEDADSEGVEGKFYTWTPAEVRSVLDPDAAETFCAVYDITAAGNFEQTNILNLPNTLAQQAQLLGRNPETLQAELATSRAQLFAHREQRVRPHLDDKVIVAWNGLIVDALARAGAVLGEGKYLAAAEQAVDFLLTRLRREDGRLLHTWRGGQAQLEAYLDDYTCLAQGLVSLYEATLQGRYLEQALALAETVLARFRDAAGGGFYFTADDQEQLIVRNKDFADSAVPSGNAMAATVLLRLAKLTGQASFAEAALETVQAAVDLMRQAPSAASQMLLAADLQLGPTYELVLAGDLQQAATREVLADLQRCFLPHKVFAYAGPAADRAPDALADLLRGKASSGESPRLYVCEGYSCQKPAEGAAEIRQAIAQLVPSSHR